MLLSEQERDNLSQDYMRTTSRLHSDLGICLKADIRAAIDALDSYIDGEASSIDASLPATFRNEAGDSEKSLLLQMLTATRYTVGA